MSLLFYRRPNYLGPEKQQLTESQCAAYLQKAVASKDWIPEKLTFAEIVKNNTLPVSSFAVHTGCSLYTSSNTCLAMLVERLYGLPNVCRAQRGVSPILPLVLRLC